MEGRVVTLLVITISIQNICSEYNETRTEMDSVMDNSTIIRNINQSLKILSESLTEGANSDIPKNSFSNFSQPNSTVNSKNISFLETTATPIKNGTWYVFKERTPDKKVRHERKKSKKMDTTSDSSQHSKSNKRERKHRRRHRFQEKNGTICKDTETRKKKHHRIDKDVSTKGTVLNEETHKKNVSEENPRQIIKVPKKNLRKNKDRKGSDEDGPFQKPEKSETIKCMGCNPKDTAKRIESFRKQLLQKFRLDSVPLSTPPPPPILPPQYNPEFMQDDHSDDPDNSFYAKTKELIIAAIDVSRHCSHRHATGCFHLDLHGKVKGHIASAKLWVFKNRDWNDKQQSFTISELEQDTSYNYTKLRPKNIVQRIETDVKTGWLQFNITSTIRKWLDKPHINHGFSIRCKTCHTRSHRVVFGSKEGYRPLLIIHFGNENRRRERRSIDCTPGETSCCRQQFYIDFGAIEDFLQILQPKGLWANYCTGSCYDGTMAHYNHTTLMQAMRWRSTSVNDSFAETLKPCCAPISYATKSLLVIDEHGDIKYSEVPNISVHACGCI